VLVPKLSESMPRASILLLIMDHDVFAQQARSCHACAPC
jgi:hypothetical protein